MFAALRSAAAAAPALRSVLQAVDWLTRQEMFCQALVMLHELQRSMGLPTGQEVAEPFHTRPYRTVHHDVTRLLIGSITDRKIRALTVGIGVLRGVLLSRLGRSVMVRVVGGGPESLEERRVDLEAVPSPRERGSGGGADPGLGQQFRGQ